MLKKLIVAAVVGGFVVAAVKGTQLGRWAWFEVRSAWHKAEKNIPIEKQIAMLEDDFKALDTKAIPAKIHELAEARNQNKRLDEQVAVMEAEQKAWHDRLVARRAEIKKANGQVSVDAALANLDAESARWEQGEKALANLRKARDETTKQADTIRDEGRTLVAKRNELGARLQTLKIKLKEIKQQEMRKGRGKADTDTGDLENRLAELEKQVGARAQESNARDEIFETQAAATPTVSRAEREARIDARLGGSAAARPAAVPKSD